MAFKRALWHSGLTYQQTCPACRTTFQYDDYKLDFRPWYADGFVYCPKCRRPLRHNEMMAIDENAPAPEVPAEQPIVVQNPDPAPKPIAVQTPNPEPQPIAVQPVAMPEEAPATPEATVEAVPVVEEALAPFCSQCGKKFAEGDRFCSGCGAKR